MGNYNPTDYEHVYDLNMEAYDDKKLADRAKSKAAAAYADAMIAANKK